MEDLLKIFNNIVDRPYETLAKWKEKNRRKIIGCMPMHVPEEIIYASGMLPATIMKGNERITLADKYVHPYVCSLVRSKFDLLLKGKLDFLDGIIFPDICDIMQQIPDIWRIHSPIPFQYNLGLIAGNLSAPTKKNYLVEQLTLFKNSLEKTFGEKITDEELRQAITVYNHNRSLLQELNQLRRNNLIQLHAKDFVYIVAASMLMPKDEHNKLLSNLLSRKALQDVDFNADAKVRIVLSGNMCDCPSTDLLRLLDELGAIVVDDDLYTGSRYFVDQVDNTINPIDGLAQRFINSVPCPNKYDVDADYADYLLSLVKRAKANGVIVLVTRYCEPAGYDYPSLKDKLFKEGIPQMLVETEYIVGNLGTIKTRIEAFIEMLRGVV